MRVFSVMLLCIKKYSTHLINQHFCGPKHALLPSIMPKHLSIFNKPHERGTTTHDDKSCFPCVYSDYRSMYFVEIHKLLQLRLKSSYFQQGFCAFLWPIVTVGLKRASLPSFELNSISRIRMSNYNECLLEFGSDLLCKFHSLKEERNRRDLPEKRAARILSDSRGLLLK